MNIRQHSGSWHAVLALGLAALSVSAQAGMLGTAATLRYDFAAGPSAFDSVVVAAGSEIVCMGAGTGNGNVCGYLDAPQTMQSLDWADLSVGYSFTGLSATFTNVAPNGFRFLDLAPGFVIGGVTLATNIVGLDLSRVSFTANSVSVEMGNLTLADGQGFTVTLVPVPEPATALLAAAGALLLAGRVRRATPAVRS
jgi:hypothetical protein